jgi:hypothetical protein
LSVKIENVEIPNSLIKHAFIVVGSGHESLVVKGAARTPEEKTKLSALSQFKPGDLVFVDVDDAGNVSNYRGKHRIVQWNLSEKSSSPEEIDFKLNLSLESKSR